MSIIVVHDPRPVDPIPDGVLFHNPGDVGALQRHSVAYLPFEQQYRYARAGFGAGEPLQPANLGSLPFVLDTGDGSCPWLYWTARVRQTGPNASGFLTLMNDTARGQYAHLGLGLTHAPLRIDGTPTVFGGWILKGKLKLGAGGGAAALAFSGSLTDAAVQVVAATTTQHEYSF